METITIQIRKKSAHEALLQLEGNNEIKVLETRPAFRARTKKSWGDLFLAKKLQQEAEALVTGEAELVTE
jgi:hypothetical protein